MPTSREIHLASRPEGAPTPETFATVSKEIPAPGPGQFLVKNLYMSVDPYMRGRMRDQKSYVPPFQVGEVMSGGAVGEVIASQNDAFPVGQHVLGMEGWREYYISEGKGQRKIDGSLAPLSAFLGVLGMPGLTAYIGLHHIGQPKEGETVFVSGAAGAVGSVVGQLAKQSGCTVVGSAGSAKKVSFLTDELGFDRAFNYKEGDLGEQIKANCPEGIDIYFDNVGGPMLDAALASMNSFGRIPVCGMISQYNATGALTGPSNIINVVSRRLKIEGFIVSDHFDKMGPFMKKVGGLLKEGKIKFEETVVEGIENAPDAFLGLFRGDNLGKMIVKL